MLLIGQGVLRKAGEKGNNNNNSRYKAPLQLLQERDNDNIPYAYVMLLQQPLRDACIQGLMTHEDQA